MFIDGTHGIERENIYYSNLVLVPYCCSVRPSRRHSPPTGKICDLVAVGGDGGLLCLRWPLARCEVVKTTALLPAGGVVRRLGPRVSRFGYPGGAGEAGAAVLRWNKSSDP